MIPILPFLLALGGLTFWWIKRGPKIRQPSAPLVIVPPTPPPAPTSVGRFPPPADALGWEHEARQNPRVNRVMGVWNQIVHKVQWVPFWFELTGDEQKAAMNAIEKGNGDQLSQTVRRAMVLFRGPDAAQYDLHDVDVIVKSILERN